MANAIGDILKNRGEYVQALQWLRKDYDVSVRFLPDKHLLATCQSLGEIYLRLHRYEDALQYQVQDKEMLSLSYILISASSILGLIWFKIYISILLMRMTIVCLVFHFFTNLCQ